MAGLAKKLRVEDCGYLVLLPPPGIRKCAERQYGSFKRGFTLPRTVKGDDIRAHFEHGVLMITLPKVAEAKGRKIEIGTA